MPGFTPSIAKGRFAMLTSASIARCSGGLSRTLNGHSERGSLA
jgi:hypothetical protein